MDVVRYLDRIGYAGSLEPRADVLAALQRAHLATVPFDALDCLLGNRVTVDPADAYRKVVERRRGGYCFELNGLFGRVLEALGFDVTLLSARPLMSDGGLAVEHAHLALLVRLDGRRLLVDVGFGFPFTTAPLDVDEPAGVDGYRVVRDGAELVAEEVDAEEPNAYRFALEPAVRAQFAPVCERFSTDPESSFVRHGPVVRQLPDGWVKVTRSMVSESHDGVRSSRRFASEAEWREELRRRFGYVVEGRSVRVTSPPAGCAD